jgi:hypothetical protein
MNIEQLAEEKYVKCNTGESTQGLETKCPFSPKKLIPTAAGLDAGYLKNGLWKKQFPAPPAGLAIPDDVFSSSRDFSKFAIYSCKFPKPSRPLYYKV